MTRGPPRRRLGANHLKGRCLYELHGSVHRNYCEKCGQFFDAKYVYDSKDISELSIIKTTLLPTDAKGYFGTKATQKQSDLCAYFSDINYITIYNILKFIYSNYNENLNKIDLPIINQIFFILKKVYKNIKSLQNKTSNKEVKFC